jgi:hypothetical protein
VSERDRPTGKWELANFGEARHGPPGYEERSGALTGCIPQQLSHHTTAVGVAWVGRTLFLVARACRGRLTGPLFVLGLLTVSKTKQKSENKDVHNLRMSKTNLYGILSGA